MSLETEWLDATDKFRFKRITPNCNHYVIYPDPTFYPNNAIPMIGSDVVKQILIPFAHRLNKIVLCHLKAAFALGTDALNAKFSIEQGTHPFLTKFVDVPLALINETASTIIETFGVSFEYEQRNWALTLNTTNTDLIIPLIYVQLVGSGGYV